MKKALLPQTKIGEFLSVECELEGKEIGLYITSADVSASCTFKFDEWGKFVEGINKANSFLKIFAEYQDNHYKAIILGEEMSSEAKTAINWSPKVIYNDKEHSSPSAAAKWLRGGKETNGWTFWKYEDSETGQVFPLDNLRSEEQRNYRRRW